MSEFPQGGDLWAGNDPFEGNDPWEQGSDPWAGRDTWVGDRDDWQQDWPNNKQDGGFCLDPWDFTYIVAIVIQILFIPFYACIYLCCFRNNDSVTKMHMVVFYLNSSVWGWVIYLFFYKVACYGTLWNEGTYIHHRHIDIFLTACIFLGIFALSSCIEMCCSREGGYFRHQKTMNECIQYMNNMKETPPIHRVEIECYHYRTTHHRVKGKTRTRRRKVTTYREWRNFVYDRWVDESDYPNLPAISMETPVVAVESTTMVSPGDLFTQAQFDNFRTNFVEQNRYRDRYINETTSTIVPGHEASVTAKSEKENEVPWWLNCGLFYFLAVIFCSCPLRVLFRSRSKRHEFEIKKLYFLDPAGTNIDNMGVNVTVNVVDNKGTVNINTNSGGIRGLSEDLQGPQGQGINSEGIPMVLQGPQGQNTSMGFVQPSEKPDYSPTQQGYPSAQTSYPSAPTGYQPVNNPTPTAPPPYNPNMP